MNNTQHTPEGVPVGSNRLAEPIAISFLYGLWLGIQGSSWWWLVGAFVMMFAVIQVLIFRDSFIREKIKRTFFTIHLYQLFKLFLLIPATAIILRLAFYSGFWGLYQSIVHFNILGVVIAIIALFLGWRMSPHYEWFIKL